MKNLFFKKFKKQFLIFGIAVAIAAVAFAFFKNSVKEENQKAEIASISTFDVDINNRDQSAAVTPTAQSLQESSDWSFWADSQGRFSFSYPPEFSITAFEEAGGEMVLAQGPNGRSFQIFIAPFEENGPITPARIKKDLPGLVMEEAQEISIGGAPALAFFGDGEGRRTREAWFIDGGYLYQATAFLEMDELLSRIMKTFKF